MQFTLLFVLISCIVMSIGAAPRELPYQGDTSTTIAVVLESRVSLEEPLVRAMDRELRRVFGPSETKINLVLPNERNAHPEFDSEVVVMRIVGKCQLGPMPPVNGHKPDTLGRTFVTDGVILPFVELDCRQISGAIRQRLASARSEDRPALLGRAMARVLAHEIYHVLGRTHHHSPDGIAAETMSPEEMLGDRLDFRYEDFERMGLIHAMGTD